MPRTFDQRVVVYMKSDMKSMAMMASENTHDGKLHDFLRAAIREKIEKTLTPLQKQGSKTIKRGTMNTDHIFKRGK